LRRPRSPGALRAQRDQPGRGRQLPARVRAVVGPLLSLGGRGRPVRPRIAGPLRGGAGPRARGGPRLSEDQIHRRARRRDRRVRRRVAPHVSPAERAVPPAPRPAPLLQRDLRTDARGCDAQDAPRRGLHRSDIVFQAELALYGWFWEIPEFLFFRRLHPAASSSMSDRERRAFYDPAHRRRVALWRWRHLFELARAAARAPLPLREKVVAQVRLARAAVAARDRLAWEIADAARDLAAALRRGASADISDRPDRAAPPPR